MFLSGLSFAVVRVLSGVQRPEFQTTLDENVSPFLRFENRSPIRTRAARAKRKGWGGFH